MNKIQLSSKSSTLGLGIHNVLGHRISRGAEASFQKQLKFVNSKTFMFALFVLHFAISNTVLLYWEGQTASQSTIILPYMQAMVNCSNCCHILN